MPGASSLGVWATECKGHEETFLGDGNVSSLIVVVVTGVYAFIRIDCAKNESTLLFVNYTSMKLTRQTKKYKVQVLWKDSWIKSLQAGPKAPHCVYHVHRIILWFALGFHIILLPFYCDNWKYCTSLYQPWLWSGGGVTISQRDFIKTRKTS